MMWCRMILGVCLSIVLFGSGCKEQQLGGPRLKTSPIVGVIEIDGAPAELVEVTCHPAADSTGIKYPVTAVTDKEGHFTISTYEGGDGLPAGTYTLTFNWIEVGFVPKGQAQGQVLRPEEVEAQRHRGRWRRGIDRPRSH